MSSATDTMVDAEVRVEIEPPTRCEHSHHGVPGWTHLHAGPATHYVRAIHACSGENINVYPACATFVAHILDRANKPWMCPRCKFIDEGRFMIEVLGPLGSPGVTR